MKFRDIINNKGCLSCENFRYLPTEHCIILRNKKGYTSLDVIFSWVKQEATEKDIDKIELAFTVGSGCHLYKRNII